MSVFNRLANGDSQLADQRLKRSFTLPNLNIGRRVAWRCLPGLGANRVWFLRSTHRARRLRGSASRWNRARQHPLRCGRGCALARNAGSQATKGCDRAALPMQPGYGWGLKMALLRTRPFLFASSTAGSIAGREVLVRLCVRDRKSQLAQISQLRYSLAWWGVKQTETDRRSHSGHWRPSSMPLASCERRRA